MKSNKSLIKFSIMIFIVLIFILMAHLFHVKNYLSVDGFNRYHQDLMLMASNNRFEFIAYYFLLYVVIVGCFIPGTIVFDLLAGYIFGVLWGSILVIVSYSCGAIVNFLLVKYLFKGIFEHKFQQMKHIINYHNKNYLLLNLIGLRLIAVIPFWVLNVLCALLNIRISTFIISTVLGIIPASIIYVIIGDGVQDSLSSNGVISADILLQPKIWLPIVLMAILLFMPNIIKLIKRYHRKIRRNH
jgi:uncharacterized membrane protein YdjX (TVP38/TMEM64 family)